MERSFMCILLILFAILAIANGGRNPFITEKLTSNTVSDGIHNVQTESPLILLKRQVASGTCEQTYGFLPCTTTVVGNIFLIIAYGYLMFLAATNLSNGSELLLEILGPGIIGGLFLPILGSFPDAMLILVSGLSGSSQTAQSQILVGMGLLSGSTVLLLTLLWGSCVVVGKCDLDGSTAVDLQDTEGLTIAALTGSGVSTDIWTSYAARIMCVSVIPFIIVQLPQFLQSSSGSHLAILIALISSIALLISYCLYQVFQPWIQRRRLAYAKHKRVVSGILGNLKMRALGRLLKDDGQPDIDVIRKVFRQLDENLDNRLSVPELKALIMGIQFDEVDLDQDGFVEEMLKDFDTSHDSYIEESEFIEGISKWLNVAKHSVASHHNSTSDSVRFINELRNKAKKEEYLLGCSDETTEGVKNPKWDSVKAVLMLLLGTGIAAAFADPLVDAVDNFSNATSIPAFFVSFIVLPLATSSEAVSALIFASRKKQKTASLTFSMIYGSVTMSNILSLAVFLAVVYIRNLTWDFSSEVFIIFIICTIMGLFASFRTTFPLWTCLVAYLLYPLSLVLVYVLDYVLGWS
ncbi:PREDICTED: uncharacterized protein LOC104611295 [Nelumbo nucifera]|uniref:EF-hand domain-containing protein n=2 Tax=Nelumbo nucifera TaxID=4432 RepID=A0A822ZGA5_NELNU|nr:PREDICTED: uncharacterized protein LOC104611295 [Nelumbo nucifera]DAD42711.1 TPA_asm: hypothetical protein HUJ06_000941 [Nelumbo nucifera]